MTCTIFPMFAITDSFAVPSPALLGSRLSALGYTRPAARRHPRYRAGTRLPALGSRLFFTLLRIRSIWPR
ncbi:MAG: hypothetical protein A3H39_12365 [candidate division NC10 bacterium RIFCSPLOWO2_02_FULL_66_22]|nr:MAG: hypothetical protein A3H39_12365 [candidate division NC10 bacterium RIFCSPLOWO2_02_FULL_66_22]